MTLTEAAFWSKRIGIVVGVLILMFMIAALIIFSSQSDELPPEYLSANYACTNTREEFLPNKLEIPSLDIPTGSEMVFELNTDSGKVESLPQIVNLYAFDIQGQTLNAQLEAKQIASDLGFDPESIYRQGTTSYIWSDKATERSLSVTARNLHFIMKTEPEYVRNLTKEASLPTENEAISIAKNSLNSLNLLDESYAGGIATSTLIDINPDGSYSKTTALAEAELIRIDFFRKQSLISINSNLVGSEAMVASLTNRLGEAEEDTKIINDKKVTYYNYSTIVGFTNPNKSNISVYVGVKDKSKDGFENVYQIEYAYWPVTPLSCGTYELVSPATALENVQKGEGSLVYLTQTDNENLDGYEPKAIQKFIVYDIDLLYYESGNELAFLQPIYLIDGDVIFKDSSKGKFHFYYPAVNYDIVQDKIELEEAPMEEEEGLL